MKAVVIPHPGPPEVLSVKEWPLPEPKAGEVRIKTRFAGVNFADTTARIGLYPDAPKPPSVIGYEVSGTVDQLGEGVSGFAVGERVMAMTLFGGYGEYACTATAAVQKIPEGMSDEEAAAFPVVYLTAYHMLHYMAEVRARDRVLIHAAAGGVGLAAVQMAKAQKAEIFGTASASKHEFLKAAGVNHCIDYRQEDFVTKIRQITNNEGVDFVLDSAGGAHLKRSYSVLRQGGRLFSFGFSSATPTGLRSWPTIIGQFLRMPRFSPLALMDSNIAVIGVNMNHLASRPELISSEFLGIVDLFKRGLVRPRVDQVFPIAKANEAHRYLADRKNIGKVLLSFV